MTVCKVSGGIFFIDDSLLVNEIWTNEWSNLKKVIIHNILSLCIIVNAAIISINHPNLLFNLLNVHTSPFPYSTFPELRPLNVSARSFTNQSHSKSSTLKTTFHHIIRKFETVDLSQEPFQNSDPLDSKLLISFRCGQILYMSRYSERLASSQWPVCTNMPRSARIPLTWPLNDPISPRSYSIYNTMATLDPGQLPRLYVHTTFILDISCAKFFEIVT